MTEPLCPHALVPTSVAFLYLDEKYLDAGADDEMQVTSLGGLLVTAGQYPALRDRLFRLLPNFLEGPDAFGTQVHAANLFPGRTNEERLTFLDGLVSLVNELGCKVYRRGMNFAPYFGLLRQRERQYLFFCFRSILLAVNASNIDAQVWPVIEIDHSQVQDGTFAGYVRWMDHATAYLNTIGVGVAEWIDDDQMVDTRRFGDLHYVSKQSIVGSAADCLLYLVHCKWLQEQGFTLTEYRATLAQIASKIDASLVDDYVACYRQAD